MLEAVKVALDPTPRQIRLMESHAGAARFAYNAGLAHVKAMLEAGAKPEWSYYGLRKWWNANKGALTLNEATGVAWWPENSKEAYNTGLESLGNALSNFSKSRKGQRHGRRMGFPKFKAKDKTTPRFTYTTGGFGLLPSDPHGLRLPRIGRVHCMENVAKRVDGARVVCMTVSQHGGRWMASLTVERPDKPAPAPPHGGSVGIDLGVKQLATLSDGTAYPHPHALKANLKRLKRAQKALSRKRKGSNRRDRARRRVAKLHARIANVRADQLNKLTTMFARTYADISIEDLNVAGMVGNHHLAQTVMDASFAQIRRQLEYKTIRTGARLHVISRWYPSSKQCSACGTVKAKLSLGERVYHCDKCGLEIDRDLNAAINIQVAGSASETLNAHGGDVRQTGHSRTMRTPAKCEPSNGASRMRLGAGLGNEAMQATPVLATN